MDETGKRAVADSGAVTKQSVWGQDDNVTLAAIHRIVGSGTWLNLAAGDGRFNNALLSHCNNVIAADNDAMALSRLVKLTPDKYAGHIKTKIFDINTRFPFPYSHFAGCLCTGTLHIFNQATLKKVIAEIIRVTRPSGGIILDFLTDIECTLADGSLHNDPNAPRYTGEEGRAMLTECFKNQPYDMLQYECDPAPVAIGNISYVVRSNCLLLTCKLQK